MSAKLWPRSTSLIQLRAFGAAEPAAGVIVDVQATPARTSDEVRAAKTMLERTEETLALKPDRLVADPAYGTGKFLRWLVDTGITPHISVWDNSAREDGTFFADYSTADCRRPRCPRRSRGASIEW
jgi:hypothetical protein